MDSNYEVTDEGIKHLTSLVLLEKIDIEYCDRLTDKCLTYLSTLPLLKTLVLLDGSDDCFSEKVLKEMQTLKDWVYE